MVTRKTVAMVDMLVTGTTAAKADMLVTGTTEAKVGVFPWPSARVTIAGAKGALPLTVRMAKEPTKWGWGTRQTNGYAELSRRPAGPAPARSLRGGDY